jgi:hypothetical protein
MRANVSGDDALHTNGGGNHGCDDEARSAEGVKVSNDQQVVYYRSNRNSVGTLAFVFGILSVLFVFTFVGWPLLPITIPLSIILGAVGINRARNSQATQSKDSYRWTDSWCSGLSVLR